MKTQGFALLLFSMMISSQAMADNLKNTVEVNATGAVTVPSDTVALLLTVATRHADLQEAKKRNDQLTTPIYQLAESQHISHPTLRGTTLSFDFTPPRSKDDQQEDYKGKNNQMFEGSKGGKGGARYDRTEVPEPPIHMARNLEVRFHDLSQAIKYLAEMTKWDSVRTTCELRLHPLSFGVANRGGHLLEARRRAVASAKEKAQLLAEQNGLKLGQATLIYDESSDFLGESDRTSRPTLPPVEPGEDPFAAESPAERRVFSPSIRLVAMQQEQRAEKLDLDHIPPAQITITASVRIVFELNKP